jgi:hypothetical protein
VVISPSRPRLDAKAVAALARLSMPADEAGVEPSLAPEPAPAPAALTVPIAEVLPAVRPAPAPAALSAPIPQARPLLAEGRPAGSAVTEAMPAPAPTFAAAPRRFVRPETVESLGLPEGTTEAMLPTGSLPADVLQVRIALTRLSRDVGRDYRALYGTALKTDLLAIDAMQRHLRREGAPKKSRELEKELLRHGALLSEILARRLGGEWVDISTKHPSEWVMLVPPDARVSPIGRVYRFVREGQSESDLVAFYLDLENNAKRK